MIYIKILVLLLLNDRVTVFALTFSVRKSKFGVFNPGFFFCFCCFLSMARWYRIHLLVQELQV